MYLVLNHDILFYNLHLRYNSSPPLLTDSTGISHPPQHQNIWGLHPRGKKIYIHFTIFTNTFIFTCYLSVESSVFLFFFKLGCQALPRTDDEIDGEDSERSHHLFGHQQCDDSGHRHSNGLRHSAQHHTHPTLCPEPGGSHNWQIRNIRFLNISEKH